MSRHPDFLRFATAFREGRHEEALSLVDGLLSRFPDQAALHWHRANCLEALQRFDEIAPAIERVLAGQPDFVPAIVKRVQYAGFPEGVDDHWDEHLSDAERERRAAAVEARALQRSRWAESELRRALALQGDNVDALAALSAVLHGRYDEAAVVESEALLGRAIELAPQRVDLLETRAQWRRAAAARWDDDPDDDDTIRTWSGQRYRRSVLEAALADHAACHALEGGHRHAVRMGTLLHDLGRFDEALARFDEALAALPADDPMRTFIVETRARSENGGAGEREQMARLLEDALRGDGKDRTLGDDHATQALLGAAQAIRAGRSVQDALEARISDDPDTQLATSIAQQILNLACEPPPGLVAVDFADYPGYQRRFIARASKALERVGLIRVCDAEAEGLFDMLGQHVLIRFHRDDEGAIGVASFAVKPKWPGWIGFLLLLATGKWKATTMVECVTQFKDGTHLSTQHESLSPFRFDGTIRIERLPQGTPIAELVERHRARVADHRARHPGAVALRATDLAGMERRWRATQRVKRAYRTAVGYVTDDELRGMLGGHYDRFAAKVRERLALLAQDLPAEA